MLRFELSDTEPVGLDIYHQLTIEPRRELLTERGALWDLYLPVMDFRLPPENPLTLATVSVKMVN